jgi:hypothetical protein
MTAVHQTREARRVTVEDDLHEAMGKVSSASGGMRLRQVLPTSSDAESRVVALELNLERINRGLLFLARQIEDLRKERG